MNLFDSNYVYANLLLQLHMEEIFQNADWLIFQLIYERLDYAQIKQLNLLILVVPPC